MRFHIRFCAITLAIILAGCSQAAIQPIVGDTATATSTGTVTLTPLPTRTLPVWMNYPSPVALSMPTAIPPPAPRLELAPGVRSLLLVGSDKPSPYKGRTDALMLVLYDPGTAKAALISLPPDLFVYIPGLTVQRLNAAYVSGGIESLLTTLEYNLGIRPEKYAVIPLDAFTYWVDGLGGVDLTVSEDLWDSCGTVREGRVHMNGQKALCYFRVRSGMEESARNRRQQELLQALYLRLAESGNFSLLPGLYQTYRDRIDTNLGYSEVIDSIPLALYLADPGRIQYFQLPAMALETWKLPGSTEAQVFLPRTTGIQ
ncbi:MAG: hypothetical protein HGA28_07865, partial [Anaerolineaceae bacterium]|nr:hypothetical protein [Anaerolineaceae bacterium]